MSNHQLATMILKMFKNDLDVVVNVVSQGPESFKSNRSEDVRSVDDNKYILPDVKGGDYHIKCDKGEHLGKLIGGSELSNISVTQENDQIGFIFNGSEPIFWDEGDELDSGNYGEVRKFTFNDQVGSGVNSVAIKKFNYYKSEYEKIFDEETGKDKKVPTGEKRMIENHLNEVEIINRIMDICDEDRGKCIFDCDIIPVSVIKDNSGNFTFGEDDNQHGYIALELMDGTLKEYYSRIGKDLKQISGDVENPDADDDVDDDDVVNADDADDAEDPSTGGAPPALYKEILDDIKKVLITTAKALKCFSDKGWYYPDLKPSNIMYRCDNNKIIIRIIDVGSLISEEDMKNIGDYILSYRDIEGDRNDWRLYNDTKSNFKYLHVYLIGVLLIRILQRSFKIKINGYPDFGDYLNVIRREENGRIKEDHIKTMINKLRSIIKKGSFDGFEDYITDIYGLFNRTILSQYDDERNIVTDLNKKRFTNEGELIDYLENMFQKD